MAFSVGTLTAYIKENEQQLTSSTLFGGKTASIIASLGNVQTGVKYKEQVNILESTAVFAANTSCGFSSSGTTTISQRTIVIGAIKVNEALCYKTLNNYYLSKAAVEGSRYTSPEDFGNFFAKSFCDRKVANIQLALETAIWQGDSQTPASGNNAYFDGIIYQEIGRAHV